MNKRDFLKTSSVLGLGAAASSSLFAGENNTNATNKWMAENDQLTDQEGQFQLPQLPYAYDALTPHIDQTTLTIHHDKHHAGYVKGSNHARAKINEAIESGDFSIIQHWEREFSYNVAGHFLHTYYWNNMTPNPNDPGKLISRYIQKSFGSMKQFRKYFYASTKTVEASGWGILAYQPATDQLVVLQAEKHQNLSQWNAIPIMVCDVWEHAYYLNYQNERGKYIEKFMELIHWEQVEKRLKLLV